MALILFQSTAQQTRHGVLAGPQSLVHAVAMESVRDNELLGGLGGTGSHELTSSRAESTLSFLFIVMLAHIGTHACCDQQQLIEADREATDDARCCVSS